MIFYTVTQEYARIKLLEDLDYLEKANEEQCEIYFFRVLQIVERNLSSDQIFMQSLITMHMDDCSDMKCECHQLVEKYDIATKRVEADLNMQLLDRSQTLRN
ncbi:hypothetical protein FGO68_gene4203 [Halteria grandinella]|uniref:Uncharacterized protein n=1 Tax=Halteria grandinella TaxID=5974 RepID=A0A8J8P657_HALGN|nr:hypothetical protein FGO68_gene4203 [Halteria grandinella]